MLQSVLVPLDGSEFSERSLPVARTIARATGAAMHLAHVHIPYEPDHLLSNTQFHFEGLDMDEYDSRHRESERRYLTRLASELGEEGTPTQPALLEGSNVANELARYAERVRPDLMVITTHGHNPVSRLWLGSTADAMVRSTHIPILAIHPERPGAAPAEVLSLQHIFVPLDRSAMAEAVLAPAVELAQATGARLTLGHFVSVPSAFGARTSASLPHNLEPVMLAAEEYLEGVARDLSRQGLRADFVVEAAESPSEAIARLSGELDADLIAIATHGYGGVRRVVMGSIADAVLRATPLPLLVMRPKYQAD